MGLIKKNLVQIDPSTGEVQEGLAVLIPTKAKLKDAFCMLFNEALLKLAIDSDLKWEDLRVLLVYLGATDFGNLIKISQKDAAEILGMRKENVSRSTKKLVEKNILVEESKQGRSKIYRLSALYGWKGDVTNYPKIYEHDSKLTTSEIWMKKEILKT